MKALEKGYKFTCSNKHFGRGGGKSPKLTYYCIIKCDILVGILQNKSDMFLAGVCSDSAKIRDTDMS